MKRSVTVLSSAALISALIWVFLSTREGSGESLSRTESSNALSNPALTADANADSRLDAVRRSERRGFRRIARIVEEGSGTPRGGVRVALFDREPATGFAALRPGASFAPRATIESDPDGWIDEPESEHSVWIDVVDPDWAGGGPQHFDPQASSRANELRVRAAGRVHGRIIAPRGYELRAAEVFAMPGLALHLEGRGVVRIPRRATCDAQGAFDLGSLEPGGGWRLLVRAEHFAPAYSPAFAIRAGARTRCDVELPIPLVVRGSVVDPEDRPASGASVTIVSEREASDEDPLDCSELRRREVRAREDGTFELIGVREGSFLLWASAEPFAPSRCGSVDVEVGAETEELTLQLCRPRSLSGRVVDEHGQAVRDAIVSVVEIAATRASSDEAQRWQQRTDDQGRFAIPGLPSLDVGDEAEVRIVLQVAAIGHAKHRVEATLPVDGAIEIALPARYAFALRVVTAVTHEPIANYVVILPRMEPDGHRFHRIEVRDFDGRFHPPTTFTVGSSIDVRAAGSDAVRWISTAEAFASGEHVVELEAPRPLFGLVVDADDEPLAGAEVRSIDGAARAISDAEGQFVLHGVSPYAVRLRISKNGFLPLELSDDRNENRELVCVLERGGSLRGTVRSADGALLARWAVIASRGEQRFLARTNARGGYALDALREGEYGIALVPEDCGIDLLVLTEELTTNAFVVSGQTTICDLADAAPPRGSIRGRVVRRDGTPVPGAQISVEGYCDTSRIEAPRAPLELIADRDGRFEVRDAAAGEWQIRASDLERDEVPNAYVRCELSAGEQAEVAIVLDVIEVRGRVVDAESGLPIGGASLHCSRTEGPGGEAIETESDDQGRFVLQRLAVGHWRVAARKEGETRSARADFELRLGEATAPLELRMVRGGSLEVTVVNDADGSREEAARLRLFQPGDYGAGSVSPAELQELGGRLGPGTYVVTAEVRGRPFALQQLVVESNRAAKVELRILEGSHVRFEIRDEAGAPVGHARLQIVSRDEDEARSSAIRFHLERRLSPFDVDRRGVASTQELPPGRYAAIAERGTQRSGDVAFEVPASGELIVPIVVR
jgi:hypothetical protein